jgi:hypothetical protein
MTAPQPPYDVEGDGPSYASPYMTSEDHTLLDEWEPIFVNGVIPTEFRAWVKTAIDTQVKEAYALGRTHQSEETNTRSKGNMGADIDADHERWERQKAELAQLSPSIDKEQP